MKSNIAIIFAGGSGVRMGSGLPKQFLEVNGKPIIIHTLEIFEDHPDIDGIYVACKEEYIDRLNRFTKLFMITKVRGIVPGGSTGQDSIYNALKAASADYPNDSTALIHDGVRPCITAETIDDALASVREYGNAVICTPMYETPVQSESGEDVETLPARSSFYTAQAPQCFPLGEILDVHEAVRKENPDYTGIVDSCTLMKQAGYDIHIVEGPRGNIKVTTPEDMFVFKAMLEYRETQNVFGFGVRDLDSRMKKG